MKHFVNAAQSAQTTQPAQPAPPSPAGAGPEAGPVASAPQRDGRQGRQPYGKMILLIAIWGSFAAINRLALNTLDVFQVTFYTFAFALLSLTIWMAAGKKFSLLARLSARQWFWLLVLSVFSFLYNFLYSLSLSLTNPVTASSINYLFPVFITLLAVPINRERMTLGKGISVLLGFAGMVLIVTNGDFSSLKIDSIPGVLLALTASLCWALFSTLGKMAEVDIVASNFVYAGVAFVASTVLMLVNSSLALPTPMAGFSMAWNGVMNFCVSYYLWFRILHTAKASFAASMSFITPFATLLFIALLLHEPITLANIAGLVIIVGGVAVQNLKCLQPKEKRN